jgi:uncharacterized protein (DUF1684 family)
MKPTHFIIILFVAAAVAIVVYSFQDGQSPEEYASELQHEREEKDQFMKINSDSPFDKSAAFHGLAYFPPDLKYLIKAALVPVKDKKMVVLPTSDGLEKKYLEYAYAEFELDGVPNKLLVLEITDPGPHRGTLFLAFADETSSRETYGAGRYLELKKAPGASSLFLDFNKAYNPYCAYSDRFSCPFPPKENLLKVAIRAGEKSYH